MAAPVDPNQADQGAIHLFHPVYHGFTYPIGCRIDIERVLPANLDEEDGEELTDNFSEPPSWVERFSPLAVQIGDQIVRGQNPADLMLKVYRTMFDLFAGIGRFIDSSVLQNTGTKVRFPFMSLAIDPDTLHRIIEADYESGDTTYGQLMRLFGQGTLAPSLTSPFHVMLSRLESEAEIRLCVRAAFVFYTRILRIYAEFLREHGEGGLMVVPWWMPEGAFSQRVLRILREEFSDFCRREKYPAAHLVVLLDNHQTQYAENDVLMKSWNQIADEDPAEGNGHGNGKVNGRARSKSQAAGLHPGVHRVSVVFRDRVFSDWIMHANPSVKKLLDRTIAKVDSDINQQNVHYGWGHFEELEAITYNPRAIINFQQKLVKLTELGYLPLSPDFFVRGKLRGEFGCISHEPQQVRIIEGSAGNGWNCEDSLDLSRWLGLRESGEKPELVARPFERTVANGKQQEPGSPCWKIAWDRARRRCHRAVVGNLETLEGGLAAVLGELTGQKALEKRVANVQEFLAQYCCVYWREHFIQHDLAEADININELVQKHLRNGVKGALDPAQVAIAGAAAQAIYFAIDSGRSIGTGWENMDQRAFYQNVTLLTLSMCNAIYIQHWLDDPRGGRKLLTLLREELIDFETAWERHHLEELGVSRQTWLNCIRSEVEDSDCNVVRRASLRVAARHLRPLGYTKEFTRQDANLTTNVGHIWSLESSRENFSYENTLFCGVSEA